MIPLVSLRPTQAETAAYRAAFDRVLDSGWYILGPEVERFEAAFAAYCGTRHCVSVGSGLDALSLALRALGVGPGDEVIVPTFTFVATWFAVSAIGAVPVGVEVDLDTGLIDVDAVRAAIGPKTAAIVPVHLYGQPADMDALSALAQRHGLLVLEDAAQAHGATTGENRVGALAQAGAFSFYPTKVLGAMDDGGAVTTNDASLAARVRALRNYGSRQKYVHDQVGVNSRLGEIQAAILSEKLQHLDTALAHRRAVANVYTAALEGGPVRPMTRRPDRESAWHLYVVQNSQRNLILNNLAHHGIQAGVHYPLSVPQQVPYVGVAQPTDHAEQLAQTVLSLSIGPHIDTLMAAHIAQTIIDIAEESA